MLGVASVLLATGAAAWWLHQPMPLKLAPGAAVADLEIEPGTRAAVVAEEVVASGADVPVLLLQLWFRLSGQARQIKAGSYEITPGTTPRKLLASLSRLSRSSTQQLVKLLVRTVNS